MRGDLLYLQHCELVLVMAVLMMMAMIDDALLLCYRLNLETSKMKTEYLLTYMVDTTGG